MWGGGGGGRGAYFPNAPFSISNSFRIKSNGWHGADVLCNLDKEFLGRLRLSAVKTNIKQFYTTLQHKSTITIDSTATVPTRTDVPEGHGAELLPALRAHGPLQAHSFLDSLGSLWGRLGVTWGRLGRSFGSPWVALNVIFQIFGAKNDHVSFSIVLSSILERILLHLGMIF